MTHPCITSAHPYLNTYHYRALAGVRLVSCIIAPQPYNDLAIVKVLENRIIDLDILPGTKEQQGATRRAQGDENEEEDAWSSSDEYDQSAFSYARHAAKALAGAVGSAVKGVADTVGDTVHSLGTGVFGTITGVGKGLGKAAAYGGRGIGKTLGIGNQRRDNEKEYEGLARKEIREAKREARKRELESGGMAEAGNAELNETQSEYGSHETERIESKNN